MRQLVLLQSAMVCYYKVQQVLQSAIGITKCDRTTLQSGRVTQIWLHTCGYGKDVHGAVEFSCTLITVGTERSNTKTLLLFFYSCVDCSIVKDHSYFAEIYLFVSPCSHSDIFLTWGYSHSKHAERAPFISLHGLSNVGCFFRVDFEVAYFVLFSSLSKTWQLNLTSESSYPYRQTH